LSLQFELKVATFGLVASSYFKVGTLLLDPFVNNNILDVSLK